MSFIQTREARVIPLAPQDLPQAAANLAKAFLHDPMFMHIFPQEHLREELLTRFFQPVLR